MCTAHSSLYRWDICLGGLPDFLDRDATGRNPQKEHGADTETPPPQEHGTANPLDRDPHGQNLERTKAQIQRSPEKEHGTQAARQEGTSYRDSPIDRQTRVNTLPCLAGCND